jgi:hypothetical protein
MNQASRRNSLAQVYTPVKQWELFESGRDTAVGQHRRSEVGRNLGGCDAIESAKGRPARCSRAAPAPARVWLPHLVIRTIVHRLLLPHFEFDGFQFDQLPFCRT